METLHASRIDDVDLLGEKLASLRRLRKLAAAPPRRRDLSVSIYLTLRSVAPRYETLIQTVDVIRTTGALHGTRNSYVDKYRVGQLGSGYYE